MWRSFASLGLVKHEAPHFSTARPTYETGSAKSVIEGMGEKPMSKKLKGKVALITGGFRGLIAISIAGQQRARIAGGKTKENRNERIYTPKKQGICPRSVRDTVQ